MRPGTFEQDWQQRYNRWADKYREDHLIAGWSAEGLSRRLALFLKVLPRAELPAGSVILDLGSGPGTYTRAISSLGYRCVGLDFSANVIRAAKAKGDGETYVRGSAYELPFARSAFRAVVCVGVLQSLSRPEIALGEMVRVLAPGGSLFLDGLNAAFWLRSLAGLANRVDKKLKCYNPREIAVEAERLGLVNSQIHWLAVPRCAQAFAPSTRAEQLSPLTRLLGHSFLLHARKR